MVLKNIELRRRVSVQSIAMVLLVFLFLYKFNVHVAIDFEVRDRNLPIMVSIETADEGRGAKRSAWRRGGKQELIRSVV